MIYRAIAAVGVAALLAGCPDDSHDSHDDKMMRYSFTVENVTAAQPLSPMTVLTHNSNFHLFELGQPASVPLEYLAEAGSNAELIALSSSDPNVHYGASGQGVIMPGSTETVTVYLDYDDLQYATVASMLVNTNDAFVEYSDIPLASIGVGQSYKMVMSVWDAGTEANDESADTVPGPASANKGAAEGFNAARNDNDKVSSHPGVVSMHDGLSSSVLEAQHRFVNPAAVVTVTRLE